MRHLLMQLVSRGLPLLRHRSVALLPRLDFSTSSLYTINAATWTQQSLTSLPISFVHNISSSSFSKPSRSYRTRSTVVTATNKSGGPSEPSSSDDEDEEDFEDDLDDVVDDEDEEESVGMGVNTAGTDWGEAALAAVRTLLATDDTLDLYSLRAFPGNKRLDIRIDKLTNQYGSPSLDEVGAFSRALYAELESALGEEVAGDIEVEVSSPGAERLVKVPEELPRFAELPMRVEYEGPEGADVLSQVLQYQDMSDAGTVTRWKLADVRANRTGKGRPLNKKQRETVIEIPVSAIKQTNLHVDI